VSLGELRAALDGVSGLAVEARGHAQVAAERLDEAARILGELAERSGTELPAEHLAKAGEEVEGVMAALHEASELVSGLGARL